MPKEKIKLVIASTTSTQNSGLLDILIPEYEKSTKYGVKVEIIAVGTGKEGLARRETQTCSLYMILSEKRNLLLKDTV